MNSPRLLAPTGELAALNSAFLKNDYEYIISRAPKYLKKNPNQAAVLNMLGVAMIYSQRPNDALPYFKQAAALLPNEPTAHINLARLHHDLGDSFAAAELYESIINRWPNQVDVYGNYGALLQASGKEAEAEAAFRKGLNRNPDSFINKRNLAALLHHMARLDESEALYRDLWESHRHAAIGFEFSAVLIKKKEFPRSIEILEAALGIDPSNIERRLLAHALERIGKLDEAENQYRRTLEAHPRDPICLLELANLLKARGHSDQAELCFRQGLESKEADLFQFNLGQFLRQQGRPVEAIESLERAIALQPYAAIYHAALASVYQDIWRLEAAEESFRRALEIDPNSVAAQSNLFYLLDASFDPAPDDLAEEKIAFGMKETLRARAHVISGWHDRDAARPIRVGFVSGDFREHPVGYFIENLLKSLHDSRRHAIEVVAYSTTGARDALTDRIADYFSEWRDISELADREAAKQIRSDAVQVLFDLAGHTAGGRLGIFAHRPAPIQVSWLGYFASTGLNEMDYLLADPWSVPEGSRQYFSEAIWTLPETRMCFTPPELEIDVGPLPALRNGFVTFGCFNQASKLGVQVFAAWARILRAVPDSRLLLKSKVLGEKAQQQRILDEFARLEVPPFRILFEGAEPRERYLTRYRDVDIALDPFPYTGGTTTVESLWMGVPVVTLAGSTLVARQGVSILSNAGLSDWIAPNLDAYVDQATARAGDIRGLATLRADLRGRLLRSPLCDADRFARHFSEAMHSMWRQRADAAAPRRPSLPKYRIDPDQPQTVHVVAATQLPEDAFWRGSALGQSLTYHLARDPRLKPRIAFENKRGLPEIFNAAIEETGDDEILIFMHDDVWLDQLDGLADIIHAGLNEFDVIGVAGNRRRVPNQPAWGFLDLRFTPDTSGQLSGRIAHGPDPFGPTSYFGAMPAPCELLDGVFLATQKSRLARQRVRFDPKFDFHFYDLDFCRSARKAGLRLGTWKLALTHQSKGNYFSSAWINTYKKYLRKWRS